MRLQFKIRTLAILMFLIAVFFGLRSQTGGRARDFVESIEIMDASTEDRLLSDANLPKSRYKISPGLQLAGTNERFSITRITVLPASFKDLILMRPTYRVEFFTRDKLRGRSAATKLYDNRHESDYQVGLFTTEFIRSVKHPR